MLSRSTYGFAKLAGMERTAKSPIPESGHATHYKRNQHYRPVSTPLVTHFVAPEPRRVSEFGGRSNAFRCATFEFTLIPLGTRSFSRRTIE
jgi:hypothetical protein